VLKVRVSIAVGVALLTYTIASRIAREARTTRATFKPYAKRVTRQCTKLEGQCLPPGLRSWAERHSLKGDLSLDDLHLGEPVQGNGQRMHRSE
jgi:hypothetical protein